MDLLQQKRLATGGTEPLEVEGRRAGLELERRRDGLTGRFGAGHDEAGLRVKAAMVHLVGEAGERRQIALDARHRDEGPAAACPLQAPLARQLTEGATDGD